MAAIPGSGGEERPTFTLVEVPFDLAGWTVLKHEQMADYLKGRREASGSTAANLESTIIRSASATPPCEKKS